MQRFSLSLSVSCDLSRSRSRPIASSLLGFIALPRVSCLANEYVLVTFRSKYFDDKTPSVKPLDWLNFFLGNIILRRAGHETTQTKALGAGSYQRIVNHGFATRQGYMHMMRRRTIWHHPCIPLVCPEKLQNAVYSLSLMTSEPPPNHGGCMTRSICLGISIKTPLL